MANPDFTRKFGSTGTKAAITNTDYNAGWDNIAGANPPKKTEFNSIDGEQDDKLSYLDIRSRQKWDATIDYLVGEFVVGSNNKLYQCILNNTNFDPTTNPLKWENALDKYLTEPEADLLYDPLGGLAAHAAATDPHTGYLLESNVVNQAEAEAGIATSVRAWTALRVKQAILALATVAQATEVLAGKAEIATQTETDAIADDARIVTPKKLGSGFTLLLATNGYIVLPSWLGSFKMAWADGVVSTVIDQTQTVNFPIVFTTFAKVGVFTTAGSTNLSDLWFQRISNTLSSCFVTSQAAGVGNQSGGATPNILVIGK